MLKLKFDPNQEFQMDAVHAATDLFEGLPLREDDFTISVGQQSREGLFAAQTEDILAYGNHSFLPGDALLANLRVVQKRNQIEPSATLQETNNIPHFSIEMETGTGKTYVYLRTIHELHARYGYSKFVIVVPGKAIREGTLKNLEITEAHFRSLYGNTPFSYVVYDSKNMSVVRDFATARHLAILVINIEAFRKDFDDEDFDVEKGVLFHRPSEKLSGRSPREFVQAVHPIVIIDEPQSVDNTPIAKRSIALMNPLFTLRYSATHRNPYNLIYRLDPIRAYEMRLVKKIAVAEVLGSGAPGANAYAKLLSVDNSGGIRAHLEIDQDSPTGPKRKKIWVKSGEDLYAKSKNHEAYHDGFMLGEISAQAGSEFVQFEPSGITLHIGEAHGGDDETVKRLQISKTIEEHFEKELELRGRGIKVLSLFFLDRVANYRVYPEEGEPTKGRYAQWFEEEYERLRQLPKYAELAQPPVAKVHDGYFAEDNSGRLKDSRGEGDTEADESAYNKIMKEKEKLLSLEEPLKFIFSHSALREGWDNPNIFQICTLNQTSAAIKKRQEIGRGMRLPVNQDGIRVFDEYINRLVVVANESYKDFAKKLQTEYEEDCGVTFGKIPESTFSGFSYEVDGVRHELTATDSKDIVELLRARGMIDENNKLTDRFDPTLAGFGLGLPAKYQSLELAITDRISQYRLEGHIVRHGRKENVKLNKRVYLDPDFAELWNRIKQKTTYAVSFSSDKLIESAASRINAMPEPEIPKVQYIKAEFNVDARGVTTTEVMNHVVAAEENIGIMPDVLSYLQKSTNLRRKTLADILIRSGRLAYFSKNPQRFMDHTVETIRRELSRLSAEGIQYERIAGQEYEMTLFEQAELSAYLNELIKADKSVYERIAVDSGVERRFAEDLERKAYIKLYVKLPAWFTIDTPVGKYNPDWAIVKDGDQKVYFVRETKGTLDEEKLRKLELQKFNCGKKHFAAIGMNDVEMVINADQI